jgi:hypothetical protein
MNKTYVGRMIFTDFTLRGMFTANSQLVEVVSAKFTAQPRVCAVLCETSKQAVNLCLNQDDGRPSTGIAEILDTQPNIAEI